MLLADHLGYQYVSASRLLARSAGLDVSPHEHWWPQHGAVLGAARLSGRLDAQLDATMVALAERKDRQVFDAWALPWTTRAPMLRIWLESDPASRYRKARVSHLADRDLSLDQCAEIVARKDDESRRIFKRLYDFDVFTDHDCFDAIVDLSAMIPAATDECAQRGIRLADAYLRELAELSCGCPSRSPARLHAAAADLPSGALVRVPNFRPNEP